MNTGGSGLPEPRLHCDRLTRHLPTNIRYRFHTLLTRLDSRLIKLQPEQDGSCECNRREEDLRAPVISGSNRPLVLYTSEHDLNPVTAFVAALVVLDRLVA